MKTQVQIKTLQIEGRDVSATGEQTILQVALENCATGGAAGVKSLKKAHSSSCWRRASRRPSAISSRAYSPSKSRYDKKSAWPVPSASAMRRIRRPRTPRLRCRNDGARTNSAASLPRSSDARTSTVAKGRMPCLPGGLPIASLISSSR